MYTSSTLKSLVPFLQEAAVRNGKACEIKPPNTLKREGHLNNIKEFSSYLTVKTMRRY
jgi:hypothetical protein